MVGVGSRRREVQHPQAVLLTFKAKPDYENPTDANGDSDYEVTVVATDSLGNRGTKAVTVKVPNVDEEGCGNPVADSAACWSPGDGQPDRP